MRNLIMFLLVGLIILAGVNFASAESAPKIKSDTVFKVDYDKIYVCQVEQESRAHDSIKISTEKLLTVWRVNPGLPEFSPAEFKEIFKGQSVCRQDTSGVFISLKPLYITETPRIRVFEYGLAGGAISKISNPDNRGEERMSWRWTIMAYFIPLITILLYGLLTNDRKKIFISTYLANLGIVIASFAAGYYFQVDTYVWMLVVVLLLYFARKIIEIINYIDWYIEWQWLFFSSFFGSSFIAHVFKYSAGPGISPSAWIYLLYFLGLGILGLGIMLLRNLKIRPSLA